MSRRAMRVSASDQQRWAEIDAQVAPLFGYWVDVLLTAPGAEGPESTREHLQDSEGPGGPGGPNGPRSAPE
jgi:hypothetical protein